MSAVSRPMYPVINRHVFLALAVSTAFLAACRWQSGSTATSSNGEPAHASNSPTHFSVISQWSGQYGGGTTAATRVLRNAAEWDAFWQQVEGGRPRALDPVREMAVAIFLGEKRTGGYGVEIVGAREEDGRLVVEYRESAPDPGAMVIQVLTAPWTVAIIQKTDLPVVFRQMGSTRGAPNKK